ncbi:MAG: hypothetical protein C5B58_05730 [Acidobacteria bacterium]|nr:MAG: hypothetical protein C5B58_05730 [Acidobacteriota bacterium]
MHELAKTTRVTGGHFFDSGLVEDMLSAYQRDPQPETLGEIIRRCEPIALSLIRSRWTMQFEDESELMSIVNRKLLVSLPQYNRARGTAFSFVSRVALNMLATTVTHRRKLAARYSPLDKTLMLTLPDETGGGFDSAVRLDDLRAQIRSIKSACTLSEETRSPALVYGIVYR